MTALEQLHAIEGSATIYDIHYCRAGVGIMFYEPPDRFEIFDKGEEWRRYLIVRHYYPTIEEAISAEYNRLFPETPEAASVLTDGSWLRS